jgi:hypothetical protein
MKFQVDLDLLVKNTSEYDYYNHIVQEQACFHHVRKQLARGSFCGLRSRPQTQALRAENNYPGRIDENHGV